jgi:predicted aconitase
VSARRDERCARDNERSDNERRAWVESDAISTAVRLRGVRSTRRARNDYDVKWY